MLLQELRKRLQLHVHEESSGSGRQQEQKEEKKVFYVIVSRQMTINAKLLAMDNSSTLKVEYFIFLKRTDL